MDCSAVRLVTTLSKTSPFNQEGQRADCDSGQAGNHAVGDFSVMSIVRKLQSEPAVDGPEDD